MKSSLVRYCRRQRAYSL